jgi:hypothetical protein
VATATRARTAAKEAEDCWRHRRVGKRRCCQPHANGASIARQRRGRRASLRITTSLFALLPAVLLTGCGGGTAADAKALHKYLAQIEPLRLSVNRLLDEADPILSANRDHRISPHQAQQRFDRLERRFAAYMEQIAAIQPHGSELRHAHDIYLHTYFLEDAYLSALTNALPSGKFGGLPQTANEQRAAIIEWRTDLTVLAARARVQLPADLQIAGRGEIAPSPTE